MHRRRSIIAALSGAALALSTAATVAGSAEAVPQHSHAAAPVSGLSLWAPDHVDAYSYGGDVYTDFGLRLIAGADPVEVQAHRPTYDDPIVAEWETADGPVALPAGSMSSFQGIDDFVTLAITSVRTGKQVALLSMPGCFNGDAQRVDPDGPARSPYPYGCPYNPYTMGSVMGIQSHYSTSVIQNYGTTITLRRGKYDVTSAIAPKWTDFFSIPAADATATTRMVVKKDVCCDDGSGSARQTPGSTALEPAGRTAPAHPTAGTFDGPKPDLQALPSWGIQLNRKGTTIRFGATVWNAGLSPMVVDGYRSQSDPDHMDAYQYFFDTDGNQVGHQLVGQMHWHGGNHNHWHFEDFAQYRLLNADLSEAVRSTKASFCLANTDAVDYTVPGADWHPENTDLSSACGGYDALSVREVLSSGSGDTYFQYRTGQAFPIRDLPDGTYYIEIKANPEDNLLEEDTTNNTSLRKVVLKTTKKGVRRLKVPQVGIIDESTVSMY